MLIILSINAVKILWQAFPRASATAAAALYDPSYTVNTDSSSASSSSSFKIKMWLIHFLINFQSISKAMANKLISMD